ncbi:hypothetical protein [Flavobacterium bizetiae]|uniref:hypothetical protein n=1 Tax=Flavobacterium bizetiae TaxID=2704140 RepID=UPI0037576100
MENKTKYVLLFTSIFLLFFSFTLLSNTGNSTSLPQQLKKESTIGKSLSLVNNDISAEFSLEDLDFDNPGLILYPAFTSLQINSFDNRSQILGDHQIRIQFHLPLFLRYHAIKIP